MSNMRTCDEYTEMFFEHLGNEFIAAKTNDEGLLHKLDVRYLIGVALGFGFEAGWKSAQDVAAADAGAEEKGE